MNENDKLYADVMQRSRAHGSGTHRETAMDMSYLANPISERLAYTAEGFLIATAVPFSRSGFQRYAVGELADPDGLLSDRDPNDSVEVFRPPEEIFSKQSMSSWEGKPVCNGHPDSLLDSNSASEHVVGHLQNVRKGPEPLESGDWPLLADLIIHDASAIRAIESGVRQVSGGYTYKLFRNGGRLEQRSIQGNHIAIVPKGRAGREIRIQAPASWRPREIEQERAARDMDEIYARSRHATAR